MNNHKMMKKDYAKSVNRLPRQLRHLDQLMRKDNVQKKKRLKGIDLQKRNKKQIPQRQLDLLKKTDYEKSKKLLKLPQDQPKKKDYVKREKLLKKLDLPYQMKPQDQLKKKDYAKSDKKQRLRLLQLRHLDQLTKRDNVKKKKKLSY